MQSFKLSTFNIRREYPNNNALFFICQTSSQFSILVSRQSIFLSPSTAGQGQRVQSAILKRMAKRR